MIKITHNFRVERIPTCGRYCDLPNQCWNPSYLDRAALIGYLLCPTNTWWEKKPNANTIFFYSINVMKVCWLFQSHISILPSLKLCVYSSPKMKYFNSINALFSVKRKLHLTSAIYLWMIQWENTNRFEQVTIFFMKSFSIFMDKF